MVSLLFLTILFASCAYAYFAGGKEGRWVSLLLIAAAMATFAASFIGYGYSRVHLPVLTIDLLLLGGLAAIAVRSRRYWPVWVLALHLGSISSHVARAAEPSLPSVIYFAMQSFWSLPLLLIMVWGIMLDRKAGLPKEAQWKAF